MRHVKMLVSERVGGNEIKGMRKQRNHIREALQEQRAVMCLELNMTNIILFTRGKEID